MKSILRIVKIAGVIIATLLLAGSIYIYSSGPALPKGTDDIIIAAINNPLPEIVKGENRLCKIEGAGYLVRKYFTSGLIKGGNSAYHGYFK